MDLLAIVLKVSLLLLASLIAAAFARRCSAAFRHDLLAAGIVGALLLPAALVVVPTWELPAAVSPQMPSTTLGVVPEIEHAEMRVARSGVLQPPTIDWQEIIVFVWAGGVLLTAGMFGVGLWRLRRLSTSAHPAGNEWEATVVSIAQQFGVSRVPRVLIGQYPLAPMTWGHRAPLILLPPDADAWPESRRRIVLAHELAHVARADWLLHVIGALLCAFQWCNPLAWLACRDRRHESERACDDRVLSFGVEGVDYATQLVHLARVAQRKRVPAPAIVRTSSLERRVRAVLNPGMNRAAVTRGARAVIGSCVGMVVLALASVSAAQALASFGGSVVDPQQAVLPDVRLILTSRDTGAKIEVRSDRNGRFEFPPLTPGTYGVEVELPGFSSLRSTIQLQSGQRMEPNLQLAVGSLEETMTVTDPGLGAIETPRVQSVNARPVPPCTAPATAGPRIGGNIRPPVRIKNVAPMYPVNWRGTGQTAYVLFEGVIGRDGTIEELRAVNDPLPDFELAAADAVRQWAWDATLLNCEPVRVAMQIHVYFGPQR